MGKPVARGELLEGSWLKLHGDPQGLPRLMRLGPEKLGNRAYSAVCAAYEFACAHEHLQVLEEEEKELIWACAVLDGTIGDDEEDGWLASQVYSDWNAPWASGCQMAAAAREAIKTGEVAGFLKAALEKAQAALEEKGI